MPNLLLPIYPMFLSIVVNYPYPARLRVLDLRTNGNAELGLLFRFDPHMVTLKKIIVNICS
jgi:hypothetical protein